MPEGSESHVLTTLSQRVSHLGIHSELEFADFLMLHKLFFLTGLNNKMKGKYLKSPQ